jgi:serine/threonine protein phosphatase PrpC
MPELTIESAQLTDVGRRRRHNEDYVSYFEPPDPDELARSGRLYIVADGVGGAAAGEVASEYAVKKVLHEYYQSNEPDLGDRLQAAIHAANQDLCQHIEQRPDLGRMGTTLVAAVIRGNTLTIANVGDSRAYLIRDGEIHQLTRDHSLVGQLVREGSITSQEAKHHPKKNVILRSLGMDPSVSADVFDGQINPGDRLLLCSDGLTRHVEDDEIAKTVIRTQGNRAVQQLVEMANARGGKDNISVMLLGVSERPWVPGKERLREVESPELETLHDTAVKRHRKAPMRFPLRVPLPLAGAITGLVVMGALAIIAFKFVIPLWKGQETGTATPASLLPPNITPIPSLSPTTVPVATPFGAPAFTEAPTATEEPTTTPVPTATEEPTATPTMTPSATPSPTPTTAVIPSPTPSFQPIGGNFPIGPNCPRTYTVQEDDNFSTIASTVTPPEMLDPGDVLCLAWSNGLAQSHVLQHGEVLKICDVCGDPGRIVFVRRSRPEYFELYDIDFSTPGYYDYDRYYPNQLTSSSLLGVSPAWSSTADRIAFVEEQLGAFQIGIAEGDSSNLQTLTSTGADIRNFQPAWSPDGNRIAYARGNGDRFDIWVMNANRSDQQPIPLIEGPEMDLQPAWSPDGSRIAFVRRNIEGNFDIWVMNTDGSDPQPLTAGPENEIQPAWSPDGDWITFIKSTQSPQRPTDEPVFGELWITRSSPGWEPWKLSENNAASPVWSPDGGFILYSRDRSDDGILQEGEAVDLWVIAVAPPGQEGAGPVMLIEGPEQDWPLAWVR